MFKLKFKFFLILSFLSSSITILNGANISSTISDQNLINACNRLRKFTYDINQKDKKLIYELLPNFKVLIQEKEVFCDLYKNSLELAEFPGEDILKSKASNPKDVFNYFGLLELTCRQIYETSQSIDQLIKFIEELQKILLSYL